uniref:Uncharacterized protein n=1 Tax=Sphaerodactylus townsendi TaxID=933632 RepID=A0ACB8G5J9_9SAUR
MYVVGSSVKILDLRAPPGDWQNHTHSGLYGKHPSPPSSQRASEVRFKLTFIGQQGTCGLHPPPLEFPVSVQILKGNPEQTSHHPFLNIFLFFKQRFRELPFPLSHSLPRLCTEQNKMAAFSEQRLPTLGGEISQDLGKGAQPEVGRDLSPPLVKTP